MKYLALVLVMICMVLSCGSETYVPQDKHCADLVADYCLAGNTCSECIMDTIYDFCMEFDINVNEIKCGYNLYTQHPSDCSCTIIGTEL